MEDRLLLSRAIVQWCSAKDHDRPYEGTNEIVMFYPFVRRGLTVPTFDFLWGLLHYWGIQLHHLTPNFIMHISIFTHLCEAFLGIDPHFDIFYHLTHVLPQHSQNNIAEVGGAGVQLHQGMEKKHMSHKLRCKVVDWKNGWFYVGNHEPYLSD